MLKIAWQQAELKNFLNKKEAAGNHLAIFLYLRMLNFKILISLKANARHYLLSFALLLSFFAMSGYVNNARPVAATINTEVLGVTHAAGKSGISYKRGVLAFCGRAVNELVARENSASQISLYNKLIVVRYLHLNQLLLSYKSIACFQFTPLLYPADGDYLAIG